MHLFPAPLPHSHTLPSLAHSSTPSADCFPSIPPSLLLQKQKQRAREQLEAATKTRGVQIIATTHSPLVLNALSPEALRQAILVARPPDSEGTILRPLGALPAFDEVVARRGVDQLLASGWLERAL